MGDRIDGLALVIHQALDVQGAGWCGEAKQLVRVGDGLKLGVLAGGLGTTNTSETVIVPSTGGGVA